MPLPKPKDGESEDDFIARCMSNETMKKDYTDNDQRLAVCFNQWKKKDESNMITGMSNIEERHYSPDTELRVNDNEEGGITGYAAVFGRYSEDLGWFKEKIAEGAFTKTIEENDIRALINHDPNMIIGRTKNKTLKLWEDEKGLGYDVKLPETTYANDLRESIRRKDITQNSFGFSTIRDEWSQDGKRRTLIEVKLFDVSPVTFPAYKQTSVKLRDQLSQFGIDFHILNAALIRSNRGVVIEADAEIFVNTIEILNRYIPVIEAPLSNKHPETKLTPVDNATLIRTRLASMTIKRYF